MIPITKSEEPELLVERAEEWTEELLRRFDEGQSFPSDWARSRYGRREIKVQLIEEAHRKCIYCESPVRHVYAGDIEHIRPKSKFPDLTFEWDNLGFACQECNREKLDRWPEDPTPINPFKDEPSTYLIAFGAFIKSRPGNAKGEVTVDLVQLNRPELLERRGEKIESLHCLASRIAEVERQDQQSMLLRQLEEMADESSAYAFIARSFICRISDSIPD